MISLLLAACTAAPPAPQETPVPSTIEPPVPEASAPADRVITLTYAVSVPAISGGELELFVPLPRNSAAQDVTAVSVEAPLAGVTSEDAWGNRFWHASHEGAHDPFTVVITSTVRRSTDVATAGAAEARDLTADEREAQAAWLASTARVPVGAEVDILAPILAELGEAAGAPARARAIYDWVVDHVEYKKTGTGWGNGDIYWACRERYGNCTDFHTLFLALARTQGIPGRFEMGLPVPLDRDEGRIGGYHCWLQLWLPGVGWFPIDASEAAKHPEQRESLFGSHPADRVLYSVGRGLRLGPSHQGPELNYFIDPYAELDGVPLEGLSREVSFQVTGGSSE